MQVSVIVPTLNEAPRIAALIAAHRASPCCREVLVVDGGSRDGTVEAAREAGARVLPAPPGRGGQLALGARQARGEVLLFQHADTVLPAGALEAIVAALGDEGVAGGNFALTFDGDSRFARWLTGFYAWFRRRGLYYGDSAIFVRRTVYERMGGIRPIALMEDYDFCLRLDDEGRVVCLDDPGAVTSSRRFEGRHPAAIFGQWLLMHALFHLRVPPRLLARLYDSIRSRERADGAVNRQSDR